MRTHNIFNINKFIWSVTKSLVIYTSVCSIAIYFLKFDIGKIGDNEFLFTFFGVMLGFGLTIFTFLIASIEGLRDKGHTKYAGNQIEINRINKTISELHTEIKDDIAFTFMSLVIIGLFIAVNISIPPFRLYSNYVFSQCNLAMSIKLSLFILNIRAIYDLIAISFKISNPTSIVR